MKRFLLVILVILMMGALIFGGCARQAPVPAPAPAPAPTPAAAPAKTIELKFSTFSPPMVWFFGERIKPWVKQIEELSKGQVKISVFPAQSLGTLKDHYKMLTSRQADICQVDIGATPGVFPLSEGIALPMVFSTTEASNATWWELSEKYMMDTEYKKVKLLWHNCIPPSQIHTTNKPVHTLEDLKGMKLSLTQAAQISALETLGATAVFIPITEMYTAMERGMVDGTLLCWDAATVFKLYEVTKYRTVAKVNSALTTFMMNLDAFNSLPPEIQQFINESTGFEMSRSVGVRFDEVDLEQLNNVIKPYDKEKGYPELYYLPEDETARWREAVKPVYEKWIAEGEAKGLPARAFFDDLLQIAAKYNK